MSFNSIEFFVFLAITYLLYRILPFRGQNMMLLIASYVFYGWWDVHLLYLIVLSTVIDFCCGAMIDSGRLNRFNRNLAFLSVIVAAVAFDTLDLLQKSFWHCREKLFSYLFPFPLSPFPYFCKKSIAMGCS
ncbi:MAG: hypothetical protein KME38_13280 [Spirirestis rafaelensis WJT71-NPBG6]|jgi:phage-related holin|nr:hypothetical protein [Spirirestis rafaelensis WJT71-NPBG6]